MTLSRYDAQSFLPFGVRATGLGGCAVASYQSGSTLQYNEFIVFALVWRGFAPAAWITHIYVDHPQSLRGGHEIWQLPKELADFEWRADGAVISVAQTANGEPRQPTDAEQRLPTPALARIVGFTPPRAGLKLSPFPRGGVPLPAVAPVLSTAGRFLALGWMRANWRAIGVEIPADAPFAGRGLEHPILSICGPMIDLRIWRP